MFEERTPHKISTTFMQYPMTLINQYLQNFSSEFLKTKINGDGQTRASIKPANTSVNLRTGDLIDVLEKNKRLMQKENPNLNLGMMGSKAAGYPIYLSFIPPLPLEPKSKYEADLKLMELQNISSRDKNDHIRGMNAVRMDENRLQQHNLPMGPYAYVDMKNHSKNMQQQVDLSYYQPHLNQPYGIPQQYYYQSMEGGLPPGYPYNQQNYFQPNHPDMLGYERMNQYIQDQYQNPSYEIPENFQIGMLDTYHQKMLSDQRQIVRSSGIPIESRSQEGPSQPQEPARNPESEEGTSTLTKAQRLKMILEKRKNNK